jgi:hypothetical protein
MWGAARGLGGVDENALGLHHLLAHVGDQLSISCRLGRRRYFSSFRRMINHAAGWRPNLPQRHLSPTTLTTFDLLPESAMGV